MFDNLCSFPLAGELFAQAVHPNEPYVAVGLSTGHVESLKLPPIDDGNNTKRRGSTGTDVVDTTWRTKRHKGSCRCLSYSVDGGQLYSAGSDGIVKAADSTTGRVLGKVGVPINKKSIAGADATDPPTVIHALSPQTFLLCTDSGALHLYDLRDPSPSLPVSASKTAFLQTRPSQTYHPHNDYISSLTPIPPSSSSTSGYSKQFLTTGGTTLALTDLRRGVLAKSEDQEELLLSSVYVTGLAVKKSSGSTGEKAVVGGGDGVITLWEKGQWDDQDERIIVSRDKETLDCMTEVPRGIAGLGKKIAVGLGDGNIRFVRLGMNQVVGEVRHDEVEGVIHIGFDAEGRMISGGGSIVKVWRETTEGDEEDEEMDKMIAKRSAASDESEDDESRDDDDDDDDDDSDEEEPRQKRKKRKRGKGTSAGPAFNFTGLD